MLLQTILNQVEPYKSFVYKSARLVGEEPKRSIEVTIRARANGRPVCSGCGRRRPGYDRLQTRRYQFVPLWGMPVFFLYQPRRVECPRCGVKVERVPWQGQRALLGCPGNLGGLRLGLVDDTSYSVWHLLEALTEDGLWLSRCVMVWTRLRPISRSWMIRVRRSIGSILWRVSS